MTSYKISNKSSGLVLGVFEAEDEDSALDEMARDAGYRDHADVAKQLDRDLDDLRAELIVTEL